MKKVAMLAISSLLIWSWKLTAAPGYGFFTRLRFLRDTAAAQDSKAEAKPVIQSFGVEVSHARDRKEIVVRSYFYAATNHPEEHRQIQAAILFWNKQSGRYAYEIGKGRKTLRYAIRFELAQAPGAYNESGYFMPLALIDAGMINAVQIVPDQDMNRLQPSGPDRQIVGYAPGNQIYIAASHGSNTVIGIHETGHKLGAGHAGGHAMGENLDLISLRVSKPTIREVLAAAGIFGRGKTGQRLIRHHRELGARLTHNGTPPAHFSLAGKVVRAK
ncbi:MAG: hypothetical protein OHK0039_44530 [Bacteroidia bacterium]